jgi:UDPglucose--hexose-1-phosphate uridylyltransferase
MSASELRQDLVSGDWVIIATARDARPRFLDEKKKPRTPSPKSTCPFENMQKSGNWPPLLAYPNEKDWQIMLIPNKYPAVAKSNVCSEPFHQGIYHARTAVGSHDLLITRDHSKNFADLDKKTAVKLFEMLQAFHVMASKDKCAEYVSSFSNWGPRAGASIWHPHYQILTLPIIPPHTAHSLRGAASYFKKNGRCVRCDIVRAEKKERVRVIEENEHGIAIMPYAAKKPFEVTILPKRHYATFRDTPLVAVKGIALLLQSVLKRIRIYANDPDVNFFVHDAPLNGNAYEYHHWHIEVVPKISIRAGFELSTGMDINPIDPNHAAEILRGKKL